MPHKARRFLFADIPTKKQIVTTSTIAHPRIALWELVVVLADPANHYIVKAHS